MVTTPRPADLGLTTLDDEITVDALPVEGDIPSWLSGNLLRTGPATWQAGSTALRHWFDGLAMLHSFTVSGGTVSYTNKYLGSTTYRSTEEAGKLTHGQFATDPCRSIFQRVQAAFSGTTTDNANVNVAKLGERFLALTEGSLPVEFDQRTLEAAGVAPYRAPGQLTTAHPHYDSGAMLNYAAKLGPRSSYRFYRVDERGTEVVASIPVRHPAYMHSFGMTERWFVLVEFPLVVEPAALALSGKPFIENYRWEPERGTRVTLVDRRTGEVGARRTLEPFFAFHHVNAYEDGSDVVVDLCAYEDTQIIQDLYLDRMHEIMHDDAQDFARSHLKRLRLSSNGAASEQVCDTTIDLPRINGRRARLPHRYVWGVGNRHGWIDQLVKIDTTDGSSLSWYEPDQHPSEPVFVSRPGADREDDGVLLSVVLDVQRGRSALLVLDAGTLRPLARAAVPHHIPYQLHGQFSRD
ncbi:carotenoid oxygenase family protein [Saccharopolyspora rhizosphaerae]|uniref:Dioxygenase n=1 Tax=Saccharopolyspora rhizosphaerae TaxID=2492662 RepID=A0A426K1R9_9PSEU|nr:carotenoid oxygenase family protein [Saccharopolyspora rhizosphaerae]RRO19233.1 carotenoid oxygenase family protein [Saccharopolyspora rhizosphaerae]